MQLLSDLAGSQNDGYRSESNECLENSAISSDTDHGWNTLLSPLDFGRKDSHELTSTIIRLANEQLPLSTVLAQHQLTFRQGMTSASGWLPSIHCPFPDHREKTPSFGYNPEQQLFNCFGCHRSGGGVHFKAYLTGRSVLEVAKEIIGSSSSVEDLVEEFQGDQQRQITEILAAYGQTCRFFLQQYIQHPQAVKYLETVGWTLDVYLRQQTLVGKIDAVCLTKIIEKITQRLSVFQLSL